MKNTLFILISLLFFSCSVQKKISEKNLKNGDLIFVEAKQENLSGAINRVTQKSKKENFDHIGLVEISDDGIFILHASPKLGSNKQILDEFYKTNLENKQNMVVYRLKPKFQKTIQSAVSKANTMLGRPYNWGYILDENSYYCSDFIERVYREYQIFEHIPMNFKNPKTGLIDDFWVDFYKKLNLDVPQDKPGTNPNQLAGSDKLDRIGFLTF